MNDDPVPVRETVREYYEALRHGEALDPFFHEHRATVKVGVSEHLVGYKAVAEALQGQTRRTTDWSVDSDALAAGRRGDTAWFSDRVALAWTRRTEDERSERDSEVDEDREQGGDGRAGSGTEATAERHEFDTRWTGALVRRPAESGLEDDWRFVSMHVSAAHALDAAGRRGGDDA